MTGVAQAPADTWIRRHRLLCYFGLTYAISWPLFLLSRFVGGSLGAVFIVIGAFGPPLAAAITIRPSGDSLNEWLRAIIRWRIPVDLGFGLGCLAHPAVRSSRIRCASGAGLLLHLAVQRVLIAVMRGRLGLPAPARH